MTEPGHGHSHLARAVAGHGLPVASDPWPRQPLSAEGWTALQEEVRQQRLQGLLLQSVSDGALPVTPAQHAEAQDAHFRAVCASLRLESATLRTLDILAAADVQAAVLKGPAVAHLDYPDPGLRLFGDIDLLIPAERFDQGVAALQAAQHVRRFPQPRAGFDRRFSKGTSFTTPDAMEIDYHRTFVMGPFGLRLRVEDLWQRQRRFELGGRSVAALGDVERFLHGCYHTVLGNVVPRLVPQRDVAQTLSTGALDVDEVLRVAARWGGEPVLAQALVTTRATLDLALQHPLLEWAQQRVLTRSERADLGVYSDPEGGYAGKSLRALRALPTLSDKVAFGVALAFPDRSYLEGRYPGSSARWVRGLRAARRLWASP